MKREERNAPNGIRIFTADLTDQGSGGPYDLVSDGFVRGFAIATLRAFLTPLADDTMLMSNEPVSAVGISSSHWRVNMTNLGLVPGEKYLLEVCVEATGVPADFKMVEVPMPLQP